MFQYHKNICYKNINKKIWFGGQENYKKSKFVGNNFEFFMDMIVKPGTIEIFEKYFKMLNCYLKLNNIDSNLVINKNFTKILISAYTVYYYPDIMNIDKENEVSKIMVNNAKGLILNIKVLNSLKFYEKFSFSQLKYIQKLFLLSQQFKKIFMEWKNLDMEAVICNLSKIYIDLEKEFDEINKNTDQEDMKQLLKITEENFTKRKRKYFKKVKKINSRNGIEIFNKYYIFLNQEIELNIQREKLSKAISDNINKAYWDILKSDMLKVPPDYS